METLPDLECGVAANCGRTCSCATCKVYVDAECVVKLEPATTNDRELLSALVQYAAQRSRLPAKLNLSHRLTGHVTYRIRGMRTTALLCDGTHSESRLLTSLLRLDLDPSLHHASTIVVMSDLPDEERGALVLDPQAADNPTLPERSPTRLRPQSAPQRQMRPAAGWNERRKARFHPQTTALAK
jgi:ferredoxin